MTGKKHSDETKIKMSKIRKGKHLNKKCYKLTESQVFEIKTRLVNGGKAFAITKCLSVDYKHINNIISNNT